MSDTPIQPIDEMLSSLIENYKNSSRLQQEVLENIRTMADQAFPAAESGVASMTPGESMMFWALSQQLDVLRSQVSQLEQLSLTTLKHILQMESRSGAAD